MDRRGYSANRNRRNNKPSLTSRADQATSWRSSGLNTRHNENGDDTMMIDMNDIKLQPYPSQQPQAFSSLNSNNNRSHIHSGVRQQGDQQQGLFAAFNGTTLSAGPTTSNNNTSLLPPPPGLQYNNYEFPPRQPFSFMNYLGSSPIGQQQQDRYSYENSLLNQFEMSKLNGINSMNDLLGDDDIFSFSEQQRANASSGGANNNNPFSVYQQQPQQGQGQSQQASAATNNNTWLPLQNVRVNAQQQPVASNSAATKACDKKSSFGPIGPIKPERQAPAQFTSWSSVVAKGLPRVSTTGTHHSLSNESSVASPPPSSVQSPTMMQQQQFGGGQQQKPRLTPVNTYPPSLSDISFCELDSSATTSSNNNYHDDDNEIIPTVITMVDNGTASSARYSNNGHTAAVSGTRYISDSIGMMTTTTLFSNRPAMRPFTVIKIKNVPYSVSTDDIGRMFKRFGDDVALPDQRVLPQRVHFIMDIHTGKTFGTAFIELGAVRGREGVNRAINVLTRLPLQGRSLKFTLSNYDELRNNLFSEWKGTFKDGLANPNVTRLKGGESELFIGQRELQKLLEICRNYKANYNRKCPERPFEYLMSISLNIPWLQSRIVSTIQRDILYECYKLATDALHFHTNKQIHSFDTSLVKRLVRTALLCDGFTAKQKIGILNNSRLPCPADLQAQIQEVDLTVARHINNDIISLLKD